MVASSGGGRSRRGASDEVLVEARALGASYTEIVQRFGGSERTARRRCADPEMRRRVADRRAEIASEALGAFARHINDAVLAITDALDEPEVGARLKAAQILFTQFERFRHAIDLDAQLVELREQVSQLRALIEPQSQPTDEE